MSILKQCTWRSQSWRSKIRIILTWTHDRYGFDSRVKFVYDRFPFSIVSHFPTKGENATSSWVSKPSASTPSLLPLPQMGLRSEPSSVAVVCTRARGLDIKPKRFCVLCSLSNSGIYRQTYSSMHNCQVTSPSPWRSLLHKSHSVSRHFRLIFFAVQIYLQITLRKAQSTAREICELRIANCWIPNLSDPKVSSRTKYI